MSSLRLFIAIELPEAVKHELAGVQNQLRSGGRAVTWVAPAAMHLTLVFLGETEETQLPEISAALHTAVPRAPFELRLDGVGAFPNQRRPSVLWVGVGGATGELGALHHAIAEALQPLGFPPEARAYSGHLTLGRLKRDAAPADREHAASALRAATPPASLAWMVEHVILFQSQLRAGGPIYTARDTIALQR